MTAAVPFAHPGRRSAVIDDLPGVLAEMQRLYEVLRTDESMERHAYCHSIARHLKLVADLMQKSDVEVRLKEVERRLGKTKPAPAKPDTELWSNGYGQ